MPDGSACYTAEEVRKIGNGLEKLERCYEKLELYRRDDGEPPFWTEPNYIVGGVVVSLSVGLLIGILLK